MIHSFPIQLLFHLIRKNPFLIAIWLFFVTLCTGGIGRVYGIHYLFLDPEYLNQVNFISFFWVGMALGNFIMSFHISSYILLGHYFPFVGILERPFAKFSLNNSLLPVAGLLVYFVAIMHFHWGNENKWLYIMGLGLGIMLMVLLMMLYFHWTNRDIFLFLTGSVDKVLRKNTISRNRLMNKYKESKENKFEVNHYLDLKLRIRSCSDLQDFYDKKAILKVFDQNHFNSVAFELAIISLVFVFGFFIENPYIQIPAAASTILMLSLILMFIGAISYWFKGWGLLLVFTLYFFANLIASSGYIHTEHAVRGLDYKQSKADYSLRKFREISAHEHVTADSIALIRSLDSWKNKFPDQSKPKLILLCVSGGGQRAAYWTVNVLQQIERHAGNSILKPVFSITGASGGMIGAAYYRELYLRQTKGQPIEMTNDRWLDNMGKDNLNAIIFSLIVNDVFLKHRKYTYDGFHYQFDRGYIFEQNLNSNLEGVLDKNLNDYHLEESNATIPRMLMAPVVANDGRKLYIASSPSSFMMITHKGENQNTPIKGVEFSRMFESNRSNKLHILSALRMSASFPYITPTISLPSTPRIEVMDAGIADNFGISDALRLAYVARDWVNQNTSGIVLLIIRDTKKEAPVEMRPYPSITDRFTFPIASVYNNLGNMQDINNDIQVAQSKNWLQVPLETISFEYDTHTMLDEMNFASQSKKIERAETERASLSWHLTTREKTNIRENINLPANQLSLKRIVSILQNDK